MATTFENGLRNHLESKPRLNANEKRIMRILDLPPSNKRRQRVLSHMEATSRAHLGASPSAAIDWSDIDWEKLFASIMALIQMIIKLFGGL